MRNTHNTLRGLLVASIALVALFLTACQAPQAIQTTLDLEATEMGLPLVNYSSEKDVIFSRTIERADGTIEITELSAIASAAALAQAEREKIDAQARVAQAEAMRDTINALAAHTAQILNPLPTVEEAPRRVVTLPDRPPLDLSSN